MFVLLLDSSSVVVVVVNFYQTLPPKVDLGSKQQKHSGNTDKKQHI